MKKLLIIIFSFVILQGCKSTGLKLQNDITVYHKLTDVPESYAFIRLENQQGLAHESFEGQVRSEFNKRGYLEVELDEADLLVALFYTIDDGSSQIASVPIFGQTGISSAYTTGSAYSYGNMAYGNATTRYTPTYGITGAAAVSRTVYKRVLKLEFVDASQFRAGNIEYEYQATVISVGSSGNIERVTPKMITAVFRNFPGESGKSYSEVVYEE